MGWVNILGHGWKSQSQHFTVNISVSRTLIAMLLHPKVGSYDFIPRFSTVSGMLGNDLPASLLAGLTLKLIQWRVQGHARDRQDHEEEEEDSLQSNGLRIALAGEKPHQETSQTAGPNGSSSSCRSHTAAGRFLWRTKKNIGPCVQNSGTA